MIKQTNNLNNETDVAHCIIAVVGMPGSGKSVVADYIEQQGFTKIHFGSLTINIVKERGLPVNEENEKKVREELRKKHGMGAYALLHLEKIREAQNKAETRGKRGTEARKKRGTEARGKGGTEARGKGGTEARGKGGVLIDGLYSWDEYKILKKEFGDALVVVAVHASPKTRHARLAARAVRPLTKTEAEQRDAAEIEQLDKGGPIALADVVIINEGNKKNLVALVHDFFFQK